jgi:REP element-mobilizing transposase RayT
MANTYTQVHLQFVFAVKYRAAVIHPSWKDELYKYITGIVQRNHHKMISINGMPNHLHLLVGLRPTQSIAELLQDIKGSSSKWINEKRLTASKFAWQEGYGAFSYSKSHLKNVIAYIENQEQHHALKTFREEYLEFLKKFEVDYDEQYIFTELI